MAGGYFLVAEPEDLGVLAEDCFLAAELEGPGELVEDRFWVAELVGCSRELADSAEVAAEPEDSALQVASRAGSAQAGFALQEVLCFGREEDYPYWNRPPKALLAHLILYRHQRSRRDRAGRWWHVGDSSLASSAALRL